MDIDKAKTAGKKWLIRLVVGGLLLFVVGSSLYTCAALKYSYSKGERVGFVQKLSKKGWVCKTNEGELSMISIAGAPSEKFLFTVPDDNVAKLIESLSGHRLELQYEEHRGIPSGCFGDTQYYVVGVKKTD